MAHSHRSTVLGRVDAFLAHRDNLDREDVRAWMPELRALFTELLVDYSRENPRGMHTRPDPKIVMRLNGLLALFAKAETISVYDEDNDELREYALTDE